jgi:hypothetical protein
MNPMLSRALVFIFSTAVSDLRAGDEGIYYKGIYLPPKLPQWGEQHPENKPSKYTIGDMGHEFVNEKLMFFIVI